MITLHKQNIGELIEEAYVLVKNSVYNLLEKKDKVVMGLVGGRSIRGLLEEMSSHDDLPWPSIIFFMIDDRVVPADHPDSNYKQAHDILFSRLIQKELIPSENIFPFTQYDSASDYGASLYYEQFKRNGGKINIGLLGIGEDGHIAGLFPNHHSIDANFMGYVGYNDAPKPPAKRISATKRIITSAGTLVSFLLGAEKQKAYDMLRDKSINVTSCPSKIILQVTESYLLTDLS